MSEPTNKKATSENLRDVSGNMTGEIIDGELIVTSEPSWKRHLTATLVDEILAPCSSKEGSNQGGWTFLSKPKLQLGDNVLVPDLAGWKKEKFPSEETDLISVVPDWVSEILSDETIRLDKVKKMPIYAQHGVAYLWLIDPQYKSLGLLRTYKLASESGRWIWLDGYFDEDKPRAEPFQEIELDLGLLLRRLAVIPTKRQTVPTAVIVSRLRTALEKGPADTEPETPSPPK